MQVHQLARPTVWLHVRHVAAAMFITAVVVGSQLLIAHRYDLAQEERLAGGRHATPTVAATATSAPTTAIGADAALRRPTVAAVNGGRPTGP